MNIYNNEEENIVKLKQGIFPRITEDTHLDNHINEAISKCMDHVKDELQSYIKKNLKSQTRRSMINDLTFVKFSEHQEQYNEIIDKIIDFYELFKCSIGNIVEVWKEKLGHINRLYDIFEYRHKKEFGLNIWEDKEIVSVMRLYFEQSKKDSEHNKRIQKLKEIEEDISENNLNTKDVSANKSKKKNKQKKKTKKKQKDGVSFNFLYKLVLLILLIYERKQK